MKSIEIRQAYCVLNMRLIILVASSLAVIQLAESSILGRLEQHRVNTMKECVEGGSALADELEESFIDILIQCSDVDEIGKYLDLDQLTCKRNAPEKCKASVQDWGKVWQKVWNSVPDPTICYEYEDVNKFVNSCK